MSNKPTVENLYNAKTIKRFVEKLKMGENGCIEWNGALDAAGYGAISITTAPGKATAVKTHRWAFQFATGVMLPSEIFVCHACDNPKCVNPTHLFPGTNQDNVDDMVRKGRNQSKLSRDDVAKIRETLRTGDKTPLELAEEFGVTRRSIYGIKNEETW